MNEQKLEACQRILKKYFDWIRVCACIDYKPKITAEKLN